MIMIHLSESIFAEIGTVNELALKIDIEDLNTFIKVAEENKLDLTILNHKDK